MLTTQELRQLQEKELNEELKKASLELVKTRIEIKNGYSKESHKLSQLKAYIARMKTLATEAKNDGEKKVSAK